MTHNEQSEVRPPEALARASKLCRSTIPGARVELIFQSLQDAQAVHKWLVNLGREVAVPVTAPVGTGEHPIDMVLFCPRCGTQHVDAPEDETTFRHRMEADYLCSVATTEAQQIAFALKARVASSRAIAPPSTSAAIDSAVREIVDMDINGRYDPRDPNSRKALAAILSRWFGKGETEQENKNA